MVLQLVHGMVAAGHFGISKTLRQLRGHFYWPSYRQNVELLVHKCDSLTACKGPTHHSHTPLQQHQVRAIIECVGVDILGPFPITDNGHYVLWAIGYFTKYVVPDQPSAIPAEKIVQEMFRECNFEAQIFQEVCHRLAVPPEPELGTGLFLTATAAAQRDTRFDERGHHQGWILPKAGL